MVKVAPKLSIIGFRAAAEPVRSLVTKFGGQPLWIGPPTWPLDADTGKPMQFVGQIHLDPTVFPVTKTTMVYLFVTEDGEDTYDPYGGQNAVVVQPGDPPHVETVALDEGPTLRHLMSDDEVPVPVSPAECEFEVDTLRAIDGQEPDEEQRRRWAGDAYLEYVERLQGALGTTRGNKIGGIPYFYRGWPAPFTPDEWSLVLQIEDDLPFFINLGTDGIGYLLVHNDLREGVFLWERPG